MKMIAALRVGHWLALAGLGFVILFAVAQPWQVRPLGWTPPTATTGAGHAGDADEVWVRDVQGGAYDEFAAGEVIAAPRLIRGVGRVVALETQTRVGRMIVDVDGARIAIQIGPVIRGTALRDAIGLTFADFASQMTYARIADELNTRAIATAAAVGDLSALQGRRVSFQGAALLVNDVLELVPTKLEAAP